MGGIEKSNIYQYFKILYGLGMIFLGGGSSEDMEFGASNCMFEFSTLMHIMLVLSDKYVGSLSAELILSLKLINLSKKKGSARVYVVEVEIYLEYPLFNSAR